MNKLNWRKRASLGVSTKVRNDYADYDYLDKLSVEELKFLKAFHREWVNSDFKHQYRKIYKGKKQKRKIYSENNSRNRDLYNIKKWSNMLLLCEQVAEFHNFYYKEYEDFLIRLIDLE